MMHRLLADAKHDRSATLGPRPMRREPMLEASCARLSGVPRGLHCQQRTAKPASHEADERDANENSLRPHATLGGTGLLESLPNLPGDDEACH